MNRLQQRPEERVISLWPIKTKHGCGEILLWMTMGGVSHNAATYDSLQTHVSTKEDIIRWWGAYFGTWLVRAREVSKQVRAASNLAVKGLFICLQIALLLNAVPLNAISSQRLLTDPPCFQIFGNGLTV